MNRVFITLTQFSNCGVVCCCCCVPRLFGYVFITYLHFMAICTDQPNWQRMEIWVWFSTFISCVCCACIPKFLFIEGRLGRMQRLNYIQLPDWCVRCALCIAFQMFSVHCFSFFAFGSSSSSPSPSSFHRWLVLILSLCVVVVDLRARRLYNAHADFDCCCSMYIYFGQWQKIWRCSRFDRYIALDIIDWNCYKFEKWTRMLFMPIMAKDNPFLWMCVFHASIDVLLLTIVSYPPWEKLLVLLFGSLIGRGMTGHQ